MAMRLCSVVLLVQLLGTGAGETCSRWLVRPADWSFGRGDFKAIAYGNGAFLAAEYTEVFVSSDGASWVAPQCVMSGNKCHYRRDIRDVIWNGTAFIAIGNAGGHLVFRIERNLLLEAGTHQGAADGIAFNGTDYLTVGGHRVARSADLSAWDDRSLEFDCGGYNCRPELLSVAWDGSQWVVVGSISAEGLVITSQDAQTWAVAYRGGPVFRDVESNGHTTLVVGDRSLMNTDDHPWSEITDLPADLQGVTWTGTSWIVVGNGGIVLESDDGMSWQVIGTSSSCLRDIASGNGTAVAVGDSALVVRGDGGSWAELIEQTPDATGVVWDGSRFIAVGQSTVNVSSDGRDWQSVECSLFDRPVWPVHVAWNGSLFVAIGSWTIPDLWPGIAEVAVSEDGVRWTQGDLQAGGMGLSVSDVAWGRDRFIAVGYGGMVTSMDGLNWEAIGDIESATTVLYDGNMWVAASDMGSYTSGDGQTWTGPHPIVPGSSGLPSGLQFPVIASDGARYVAVDSFGDRAAVSEDAVEWQDVVLPFDRLSDVIWTGSDWVIVSTTGEVAVSLDGYSWHQQRFPWVVADPPTFTAAEQLFTLGAGGGRVVALSRAATLIRDCAPPPPRPVGGRHGDSP